MPLLAGTDTPIPCIVPPFDALRTATANAGRFLGSLARGSSAFGVVQEKIAGVMLRGRWISHDELLQLRIH